MSDRAQWYARLQRAFAADAASGLSALYQLRFDDAPPYLMHIDERELQLEDRVCARPSVTIFFDTFENHCAIIEGRMDAMQAFLEGRFRSDGHIVLVMRMLQSFVPQYALTGPEELR